MASIRKTTFGAVVDILLPHMSTISERQALLNVAPLGTSILGAIEWDGSARKFTTHLVDTLVRYGDTHGEPTIVLVLQALANDVGEQQQRKITELVAQINQEFADPSIPPLPVVSNTSQGESLWKWLIGAVIVPLIAALIGLYSGWFSNSPNPVPITNTPIRQQTLTPSITPVPSGNIAIEILFSTNEVLTIAVQEDSVLTNLELRVASGSVFPYRDFALLQNSGGLAQAGQCFQYVLSNTDPVSLRSCDASNTNEIELQEADIFWVDFKTNRLLDIVVYVNSSQLGFCAAQNPRCEFEFSESD